MRRIASVLAALLIVAGLIPAGTLIAERVAFESARNSVLLIVDEPALREAASDQGIAPLELFERYRKNGVLAIAIVEQTLGELADSGEVALLAAAQANAILAIAAPETPPLPAGGVLAADRTGGAFVAQAVAKTGRAVDQVELGGLLWSVFDFDPRELPAGPDLAAVRRYHEAGALIAYRPVHHPSLARVGDDWPGEARYIIHSGTRAAGFPALIDQAVAASSNRVTALVEGTPQPGVDRIARAAPAARLFSIVETWQEILPPEETASKFRLAAVERGNHLLYVRPYDTAAATERYLATLATGLREAGFQFGPPDALEYLPNRTLRLAASMGVGGGLLALALTFQGVLLGAALALGLAALALVAVGPSFAAPAMLASVVFPVLALTHRTPGWLGLLRTYGVTLVGAALLLAIGSDRLAMLAVTPFRGVQATLLGPPVLVALWAVIRSGALRVGLERLWKHPVRLGEAVVAVAILGALAVIALRRGNLGPLSPTTLELSLREVLSENLVRPRFKELAATPALVLAVFGRWGEPAWAVLLVIAAIGQSSILNTFSHYHTPVLISLQRTVNGAAIGTVIGLLALALIGWAVRPWRERQGRRPADLA